MLGLSNARIWGDEPQNPALTLDLALEKGNEIMFCSEARDVWLIAEDIQVNSITVLLRVREGTWTPDANLDKVCPWVEGVMRSAGFDWVRPPDSGLKRTLRPFIEVKKKKRSDTKQ